MLGRAVWNAFARNLGAVPVAVTPIGLLVALALGVQVVTKLIAIG